MPQGHYYHSVLSRGKVITPLYMDMERHLYQLVGIVMEKEDKCT